MMFMHKNKNYEAGEAIVEYFDGDMKIVQPGGFVRCAVSGQRIPIKELKYWNVDKQEPYYSPKEVLESMGLELGKK